MILADARVNSLINDDDFCDEILKYVAENNDKIPPLFPKGYDT